MKYVKMTLQAKQQGAALAMALMVLLIMTLVAVSAMDGSTLGYKMSVNSIYHQEAFSASESARDAVHEPFIEFMFEEDWNNVTMPDGLDDIGEPHFLNANADAEDVTDTSSLANDLAYRLEDNNGNIIVEGDIMVTIGQTVVNTSGAGSAQYKGYHGAGVGMGGQGGIHKYFEFRSGGRSTANAAAWTAADFRYVP